MSRRTLLDLTIIAAVAAAVHGLILLDPGIYFDDWLIYTYVIEKDWDLLAAIVRDRGIPPVETYWWWMFRDLPVFAYRLAAFVMVIWMAGVAMLSARTSTFLTRQESLLAGIFMVCYSGFHTWVLFCTSHYELFYCLFLTASLLAFQAERESGRRHWARRVAALALFSASYGLNSLLLLMLVFAGVLLLYVRRIRGLTLVQLIVRVVPARLDYIALPVVYWFTVRWLIPPRGLMDGYNQFLMTWEAIETKFQQFVDNSIVAQARIAIDQLAAHPAAIPIALTAAGVMWWSFKRTPDADVPRARWALLPAATVWCALAMFPYAAVGKPATTIGWDTRHAILVSFPLAVALIGLLRIFSPRDASRVSLATITIVALLSTGMSLTMIKIYLALQSRAIKDRSVMQQLAAMPEARAASVFWLHDRLPQPLGETYRYFEWSGMFEHALGGQSRVAFDRRIYKDSKVLVEDRRFFVARYRLRDFDPAGCQVELTLDWKHPDHWGLSPVPRATELVRTYQRLRFSGDDETFRRFLNDLTRVTLTPVDAPEAVNCRR